MFQVQDGSQNGTKAPANGAQELPKVVANQRAPWLATTLVPKAARNDTKNCQKDPQMGPKRVLKWLPTRGPLGWQPLWCPKCSKMTPKIVERIPKWDTLGHKRVPKWLPTRGPLGWQPLWFHSCEHKRAIPHPIPPFPPHPNSSYHIHPPANQPATWPPGSQLPAQAASPCPQ